MTGNLTRHSSAATDRAARAASRNFEKYLEPNYERNEESVGPLFEPIAREKPVRRRVHSPITNINNIKKQINFDTLKQEMLKSSFRHRQLKGGKLRRRSPKLPPVCGRSPPCDCPEDQVYATKLRLRKKLVLIHQYTGFQIDMNREIKCFMTFYKNHIFFN